MFKQDMTLELEAQSEPGSQSRIGALVARFRLRWNRYGPNCSWALISSALSQLENISVMMVVARCLSAEAFGKYALLVSTLATAISISGLSLGMTATRCVSWNLSSNHERLARSLALCRIVTLASSLIAAGVLMFFARQLCGVLGQPALEPLLKCGAFYVFFVTENGYQNGAISGFLAFRELALINGIQLVIGLTVAIVFTSWFGLVGAITGLVLSGFATWLQTDMVLRRYLKRHNIVPDYRHSFRDHHPVTKVALPASAGGILVSLALWALTAISSAQHDGILAVGAFAVATNFRLAALFVPVVLQKVVSAHLSRAEYRQNPIAYKRLYQKGLFGSVMLSVLVAGTIFVLRNPLLSMFGHTQRVGSIFFGLLLAASVIEAYGMAAYQVIATTSSLAWQTLVMLVWCPTLVGVAWLSARHNAGAAGMAVAMLAAWSAASVSYTIISKVLLRRLNNCRDVIRPVLPLVARKALAG